MRWALLPWQVLGDLGLFAKWAYTDTHDKLPSFDPAQHNATQAAQQVEMTISRLKALYMLPHPLNTTLSLFIRR